MSQLSNGKDNHEPETSPLSENLRRGFEKIYGENVPPMEIHIFMEQWEGFSVENLEQALLYGQERDRLLAICLLGEESLLSAQWLLRPCLHSSNPKERWLSASYLGKIKDEEAFPVLVHMLTEFLPSAQSSSLVEDQSWFDEMRTDILLVLRLWDTPILVEGFRTALIRVIQAEQYLPDLPRIRFQRFAWCTYQEGLLQELGRRGSFWSIVTCSFFPYWSEACSCANGCSRLPC